MLVARGSSDNAAVYGRYLLGITSRRPVALAAPSLLTLYGVDPGVDGWLAVAVSQSGRTPEIVDVARELTTYADAVDHDPARLAAAEERRAAVIVVGSRGRGALVSLDTKWTAEGLRRLGIYGPELNQTRLTVPGSTPSILATISVCTVSWPCPRCQSRRSTTSGIPASSLRCATRTARPADMRSRSSRGPVSQSSRIRSRPTNGSCAAAASPTGADVALESALLIGTTALVSTVPAVSYWLARKAWMPVAVQVLARLLDTVAGARSAVAVLAGDTGTGKSVLVGWAVEEAPDGGARPGSATPSAVVARASRNGMRRSRRGRPTAASGRRR